MIAFDKAVRIARKKEGYELCTCPEHGFGEDCTYDGKTAPAVIVLCPIVQFYPKPSYLFHSVEDFLKSSDTYYRARGWIK